MTSELGSISSRLDLQAITRFGPKRTRLGEFPAEIVQRLETEAGHVRERLDRLDLPGDHPAVGWALQALETGDVLTANEYVDMAEAGNELPVALTPLLTEFFPGTVNQLEELLRREPASASAT